MSGVDRYNLQLQNSHDIVLRAAGGKVVAIQQEKKGMSDRDKKEREKEGNKNIGELMVENHLIV